MRSASNEKLCSFMVEYGGKFVLDDAEIADQDTFRRLTQVNIPAIIYPYIREHVSDLSRRSGGDPIHLPPVNFVMLAESENRSQIENKEYL
ncbi:hypothetical protein DA2_0124 [Desulfovibrio sp. A2]|nr:hypothetical protein DA2_0124 [Desulfovibrio sp. A2]